MMIVSAQDHAANDGQLFLWDNPPDTGHPGEDFNCRCQAAPIQVAGGGPVITAAVIALMIKNRERLKTLAQTILRKPIKPNLRDTRTWPKPPTKDKLRDGLPSRNKPRSRGEKSIYDEKGGEWRYDPGDNRHNPHWNYKPSGKNQEWQNIRIDDIPHLKQIVRDSYAKN